jgi:mRNA-degrading endonuclease RelE of RelBE toxin-antitoxin system
MVNEPFQVVPTRQAERDIRDLRPYQRRVVEELLALEHNPTAGHTLKGSLDGARSLEFSLPGGAYRAAYIVLVEERVCLVFQVGPHEGFDEKAERRYQALKSQGQVE